METRSEAIQIAFRLTLAAITFIIAWHDLTFGIVFTLIAGIMIRFVDSEFKESDRLTIYDRILSYGNNHLGKTMTFETLSDNFEGLYTKDELAEAIYQLNHAKVVKVNVY